MSDYCRIEQPTLEDCEPKKATVKDELITMCGLLKEIHVNVRSIREAVGGESQLDAPTQNPSDEPSMLEMIISENKHAETILKEIFEIKSLLW